MGTHLVAEYHTFEYIFIFSQSIFISFIVSSLNKFVSLRFSSEELFSLLVLDSEVFGELLFDSDSEDSEDEAFDFDSEVSEELLLDSDCKDSEDEAFDSDSGESVLAGVELSGSKVFGDGGVLSSDS